MDIKKLRILIVEDEDFQRNMIVRILKSMGLHYIDEAIDGYAALDLIKTKDSFFDILICDLKMRGMDGIELIRHLSENKTKIKVIIASGLEQTLITSIQKMASVYGVHILGIIEKPISKKKLELIFYKYLSIRTDVKPNKIKSPIHTFTKKNLLEGLKNEEFEPFYQPKIEIATGIIKGLEALARWRHPQLGIITPNNFILLMEHHGIIDDLTWVMLKKSAQHCSSWRAAGLLITVSVNLSLMSLSDLSLAYRITEAILQEGLDPSHMILEVTESSTTSQIGNVLENLSRLRMNGFGLSIDDFGTGYSSIQQLMRIAYTELKIDQSFVTNAFLYETNRVILASSLELSRKLMITSVAEGVESQEDWNYLLKLGCDLAQGYFISKPIPADQIYDWAIQWNRIRFPHLKK